MCKIWLGSLTYKDNQKNKTKASLLFFTIHIVPGGIRMDIKKTILLFLCIAGVAYAYIAIHTYFKIPFSSQIIENNIAIQTTSLSDSCTANTDCSTGYCDIQGTLKTGTCQTCGNANAECTSDGQCCNSICATSGSHTICSCAPQTSCPCNDDSQCVGIASSGISYTGYCTSSGICEPCQTYGGCSSDSVCCS